MLDLYSAAARLAVLVLAGFLFAACYRSQPKPSWAGLTSDERFHLTPNESINAQEHFACAADSVSHAFVGEDPLEYREGAQYLFPPDCGVQHFPDDNHATCSSISRTLPLVFGTWRGAERVLRELREPSLSGAVPEAVQRVLRFADTPNTWGTVLMLRYVELEDRGILIAKRGMAWHTWYKDYYREYPRRVVGPEVVACVREMIDELGFSVEPEVEGFTPEMGLMDEPLPLIYNCSPLTCKIGNWIIEQRTGAEHDVIIQRRLDFNVKLGILFHYLLNLSGVDEN